MSLMDPFPVTDLRSEVELMHMHRHCHDSNARHWTESESASSLLSPRSRSLKCSYGSGSGALSAPPAASGAEPQPKSNLAHFSLTILTSGGNNFNNAPENQLAKFLRLPDFRGG